MDRFFIELVLTLGTRNIIENCRRRKKAAYVKKAATRRTFFLFIYCQIRPFGVIIGWIWMILLI